MTNEDLDEINQIFIDQYFPYLTVNVKHVDEVDGRYIGVTDDPNIIVLFPPIKS